MRHSKRLLAAAIGITLSFTGVLVARTLAQAQQARNDASQSGPDDVLSTPDAPGAPTLGIDVDVVLVPVTVTDPANHYVTGLKKEHFQIWEDKIEQDLAYFSTEGARMSLGMILDTSGSMQPTLNAASQNAGRCLDVSDAGDEYFLVLFADRPQPATEFTSDIRSLQSKLVFLRARGSTALYDAVYDGLMKLRDGTNPRKALVIVTDGYENNSRRSPRDLKELIKEADVQIYTIGNQGDGAIRELAQMTGGRALVNPGRGSLGSICNAMVEELKNQYLLGYKSTNDARNGKWRDIRVKLTPPPGVPKLNLRSKSGYFASDGKDITDSDL